MAGKYCCALVAARGLIAFESELTNGTHDTPCPQINRGSHRFAVSKRERAGTGQSVPSRIIIGTATAMAMARVLDQENLLNAECPLSRPRRHLSLIASSPSLAYHCRQRTLNAIGFES